MPVALATATRGRSRVGCGRSVCTGAMAPQPQVAPVPQRGPQSQPQSATSMTSEVVGTNRLVSLASSSMCTRVAGGGSSVRPGSGRNGTRCRAVAPNSARVSARAGI